LIYGIPPYRLSKDIVRNRSRLWQPLALSFFTEQAIDKNNMKNLMDKYDAVFLAGGTWKEREAGIPGRNTCFQGAAFYAT